ncbi:hypothetical protein [Pseudomonas fluorescens]|uniref:hypothetical protein n=1 Tax=Pseudomonas fluorescens TaxID=294 RepID=UPI0015901082|nr:hypothetical protein [Pseudomonas fluorescens]
MKLIDRFAVGALLLFSAQVYSQEQSTLSGASSAERKYIALPALLDVLKRYMAFTTC